MRTSTTTGDLLTAVHEYPGVTVKELVEYVAVGQGRVHQILAELRRAGEVRKDGRRWFPAVGASQRMADENFMTIRVPVRALFSDNPKVKLAIDTLASFR